MPEINLSDKRGRDAVVSAEGVTSPLQVRWIDDAGHQATSRKVLKSTVEHDGDALLAAAGGLAKVADALIAGDPEVDLERTGAYLDDVSRVYITPQRKIVHKITQWEVVRAPDGTEKERRPRRPAEPNTAAETPLKWTGRMMKKSQVFNRFVFSRKLQITHVNGLTYDFLYGMAKELEEAESLLLVAAGAKGNEPLVFRRGGLAYRGFLEGRTEGDRYALILHLTNQELKAPGPPPGEDGGGEERKQEGPEDG